MWTTGAAATATDDEVWWAHIALQALDDAADAMDAAETASAGLVEDSAWRHDGMSARALREVLESTFSAIRAEVSAVAYARERLRSTVWS